MESVDVPMEPVEPKMASFFMRSLFSQIESGLVGDVLLGMEHLPAVLCCQVFEAGV